VDPRLAARWLEHAWPGNVRELANGCAYAVRVAGATEWVGPEHWPPVAPLGAERRSFGLHAETRALEERRLREALGGARGNKSRAARTLGLSRQGLLKKLRRYGLVGPTEPEGLESVAPSTAADGSVLDGAGTGP
jgi:two-component system NtrC family response regulator